MNNIVIYILLGSVFFTSLIADYTVHEMLKETRKNLPMKINDYMTFTRIENYGLDVVVYIVINDTIKNREGFVNKLEDMMLKSECTDPFKRIVMHNQKIIFEYKYYDKKEMYLGSNYLHEKKCVNNNYLWDKFYSYEVDKFYQEFNSNKKENIENGKLYSCNYNGLLSILLIEDNALYMKTRGKYRKYIPTNLNNTYVNINDDNFKIRIESTNIFVINNFKEIILECKIVKEK